MTLTLAVETSSRVYGAALLDDDRVVARASADRGDPGFVDVGVLAGGVIRDAGRSVTDLDRLAVDVGPGNLASVRAGIAYVNAVAFARGVPVVAIDSLSLLTTQTGHLPALVLRPAGGAAVYASLTGADGHVVLRHGELDVVVKELAERIGEGSGVTVALAGARRGPAAALLAEHGLAARDTGLDAPDVDALTVRLRAGDHEPAVVSAAPLTESSVRFRGDAFTAAREALLDGGVALVPTDTVYGLAVHPRRPDAIDALFALKDRPRTRELPIMVATPDELPALGVQVTEQARRLLAAFSPGPITVAMGVDPAVAPAWLAGREEIGVRVPSDPDLRALLSDVGALLVTSANAHGEPTAQAPGPILDQLAGRPDAVVDGGVRSGVPSTVVNCHLDTPRIEREGAVPAEEIERVLHQ
ncbi:L-threonylcarbamoyladenylate synthase [Actinomycetospora sp. TBRC 11914]|uniref:L-threonylcarbamoyladenylate synthase n=1 Tax=Actinomycetospora sp. TBRC 11914 TaxID=2729387 RepID=UPI00145DBBE7|nr:L-threonylcarbamoyladenylate synthase [Actinomycetospora sp. TBRC 11914]NMO91290.1 threonylcarbamoyl-AMP synthase [Actinomycetospora sp. TBRC 11914]